ncbi:MAG: amidohydrolase [Chitinophagaceae bacterium]|nr:MAG: amidohydrolase [Chitinophagaceae bacterium]
MKRLFLPLLLLSFAISKSQAQVTYPEIGVANPQSPTYAFVNATVVKDAANIIQDAALIIKEGKIISVGKSPIPKDAIVVDCKGKYIYPSFIDMYSTYGVPIPQRAASAGGGFFGAQQFTTNTKGPYNWNQAIKSEVNAVNVFSTDDKAAQSLREVGFGTVLTHQKDGIARGTGLVATLVDKKENLTILKDKAAAFYSFSKGTSSQSYPSSMMGAVALLRQTYLDAQWYKNKPVKEGLNQSLAAWNEAQTLPQIFEVSDKWSAIRADRIGDEFGVQYIIKAGGDEYQRITEIAATKAPFILSLNFPDAQKLDDPNDARFVAWRDMAHWEMAPSNAAAFEKANIPFALTAADLRDTKLFLTNLRKAIQYGLTEKMALEALTKNPAAFLKISDKVGSLQPGLVANFFISNGNIFVDKSVILENWVQGVKYDINAKQDIEPIGQYKLIVQEGAVQSNYTLKVNSKSQASIIDKTPLTTRFSADGKNVSIIFSNAAKPVMGKDSSSTRSAGEQTRLSGTIYENGWQGIGYNAKGEHITWKAVLEKDTTIAVKETPVQMAKTGTKIVYPFSSYGTAGLPQQELILIQNATVWTNEADGILQNADVLVRNGKIAQVGKNISAAGARVIDGTGKHLTSGIIDEHTHIAAFSINEGGQSVTSEVRIGDNLNPDDINIYRQLSGGVTVGQVLHGSANTIGGQSQLIKLRWGADDEGLKFKGADPFIKFALGENVKRTAASQGNTRYPDTRMGVNEVLTDAFQRARDYEKAIKAGDKDVRRDLELDALVEILNKKRFITCHSYVQSEILGLLNVAEKFDFRINTLTHILEGYKVADRIKQHGANVSTFSDWWGYKLEVQDAIPYNAAIMQKMGLNVCINSDDAEMARRLNQEAAKVMKYGGVTEEQAWKMVTLNPAKALHIDKQVGSIKVGKDADLVLWSHHPLSIYAQANYTLIDGAVYFDREKDKEHRKFITADKNRLTQKMMGAGKAGAFTVPARPTAQVVLHCEDHEHNDGILSVDEFDFNF